MGFPGVPSFCANLGNGGDKEDRSEVAPILLTRWLHFLGNVG